MLEIATGPGSDLYLVVLLLHILTSIVGFGGVLLNGLYAMQAQRRPGPAGRAVSEANYAVSMFAERFIYAVPVTGVVLVVVSDDAWRWSDTWIWLSLVIYVVSLGISHAVLMPNHRKINALLAEMEQSPPAGGPPPQVAAIQQLGKQQGLASAVLDVALVVILVLMLWKPGT